MKQQKEWHRLMHNALRYLGKSFAGYRYCLLILTDDAANDGVKSVSNMMSNRAAIAAMKKYVAGAEARMSDKLTQEKGHG